MIKCNGTGPVPSWYRAGQALIEFAFCMIVILLMIYGTIMVFRWTGLDLAERRAAHDRSLTVLANENYRDCVTFDTREVGCVQTDNPFWCDQHVVRCCPCIAYRDMETGPMKQLDTYFYKPIGMNAVWEGD